MLLAARLGKARGGGVPAGPPRGDEKIIKLPVAMYLNISIWYTHCRKQRSRV